MYIASFQLHNSLHQKDCVHSSRMLINTTISIITCHSQYDSSSIYTAFTLIVNNFNHIYHIYTSCSLMLCSRVFLTKTSVLGQFIALGYACRYAERSKLEKSSYCVTWRLPITFGGSTHSSGGNSVLYLCDTSQTIQLSDEGNKILVSILFKNTTPKIFWIQTFAVITSST